ncbi:MAG: radical SAM protein, partial [Spirochaetaceae bacterium]|nr:radical SAM protein [Spirochaetaceae bacterium]
MARYIDPPRDIGDGLLGVEKPARYTGGEAGRLARKDAALQTVIAFPDVYEIGMSNYALKIIYNRLNALPGVSCDRAFAPAPDFEALIKEKAVPLYALDTGLVLHDADVLMFTIGYELSATALLAMLAAACIPPRSERRSERDPLVVAGGVGVSNPLPFSAFIDVFWIGEAEAGFFELIAEARALKERGADRAALAAHFRAHPAVWYAGKQPARPGGQAARRAVWAGFSRELSAAVYPIPSMRIVQQHGYVEIMRGCPNGCRFCHAGIWYRPMRQKDAALVVREVDAYVQKTGIREISLSSLSSADYNGIGLLIDKLHA